MSIKYREICRHRYWQSLWSLLYSLRCVGYTLCIMIMYLLYVLTDVQYYMWHEKSFEHEYHLTMTHIDIRKIQENEEYLGPPTNILPNSYIIENKYLCEKNDSETMKPLYLLILVKSAIENKQARQVIRMTWGDKHRLERDHIKLAFLLGRNTFNISAEEEQELYEDIIQIDKIDAYHDLTYKTVMMLRWITKNCLSMSLGPSYNDIKNYVIFVDDDYYLDVDALVEYLKLIDEDKKMTTYERQTFITGHVFKMSLPYRNLYTRFYVSNAEYPYDRYPPYISGGCILMSRYNARLFYIASKYTRLFRFEDVYIGMLAYSMSIRLVKDDKRFPHPAKIFNWNQTKFLTPLIPFPGNGTNTTETPIGVHGYRGQKLLNIWNKLYKKI